MDILVCPACKGQLTLTIENEINNEVETGAMNCTRCKVDYPISDSIPNLISPVKLS